MNKPIENYHKKLNEDDLNARDELSKFIHGLSISDVTRLETHMIAA